MKVRIEPSWYKALEQEFDKEYFARLAQAVHQAYATRPVYPPAACVFRAFDLTPFDQVKVVILGQDPYHGRGQAHGLSFSVPEGVQQPPSLRNIFEELASDLEVTAPTSGDLTQWAEQGVLLLNAALTVEEGKPMSHSMLGWHHFTDRVIEILSAEREHLVFVLWGSFAQGKRGLIDGTRHLILQAPHPSPLSAYRGFFGSKPFSQINYYLVSHGIAPIRWV